MTQNKKKILITGMNKLQNTRDFFLKQQLSVVPSHYSLIRCLEDMGHEVEQRMTKLGEDLSEYDRVIVFLAAPSQLVVGAFYNGLWAIANRPDCILAFDDWQIPDIMKSIEACKDDEKLFNKFTIGNSLNFDKKLTEEKILKYRDYYRKAIYTIIEKKNRVLLSAFKGGDISKLIDYPLELVYTYNPNPYHLNRHHSVHPQHKQKKFNFASLVQSKTKKWLKKQDIFDWEVEFFGNKAEKQRRLKEEEMVKVFAEHWGCLMPGYEHAGSGWWRARPLQVADCESILIGHKDEMMIYYKDEKLAGIIACDLENMTCEQLIETAKKQKEALYRNHPLKKEIQQEELKTALNL